METNLHEPSAVDDDSSFAALGNVAVKTSERAREQAAAPAHARKPTRTSLIRIRIAGSRADSTGSESAAATPGSAVRRLRPAASVAGPPLYIVTAYDGGRLVGALGVCTDSTRGFGADELYYGEPAAAPVRGLRLCELTGLAIDDRAPTKTVLASLFHTAYLYAHRLHGIDAAVIEIAARHAPFLVRAAGFERIARSRGDRYPGVSTALLYVPFDRIAEGIRRWAGKPELGGETRTLFPYAFSPAEEQGVLDRLRRQHIAFGA